MAENTITGLNVSFPIYNENGSSFNNLVLHKVTVDSVVMSLADKITGEVYYIDNTLNVTMGEYITYNDVNYILLNPPTIIKEGMVSDNSELKGMTKYSFEFYHPMCLLANYPFSDVAVSSDEVRYKSEDKTFNWIGYPNDYIAKLNKNLENTKFVVVKSDRFPVEKENELCDVISFDNSTIADALKVSYETWGVPYVIGQIVEGEYFYTNTNNEEIDYYDEGKRFVIIFGLPSNEIYESESDENNNNPFVFKYGQGVGLKNNSRTPRNNKIITRIAGYGSEDNVPYGYPQIRWYGDSRWDYTAYQGSTIYYDEDGKVTNTPAEDAYTLYMGIVGGAYVKLIKHPFTRKHLMPSVYSQNVFNKVSPYNPDGSINTNYDPYIELVDYYDAISDVDYDYPNEINDASPSYEIHEFEDIKPELGQNVSIKNVFPINNDGTPASKWDDAMDDDGNYLQSYFKITLPVLSFDIYACAAITQEMSVVMRSGACIGCTFPVQVDWDDYKRNFYDSDGNFAPNGSQRDLTKYPNSRNTNVTLILQKEIETFGTLMPNVYQVPIGESSPNANDGDTFVIVGISLPDTYISSAEERLDEAMKSYMLENNVYYFDYPLKFDEYFLSQNLNILSQIRTNTIIRFEYAGEELQLFVKQLTIKYGQSILPQYDITLTDNVDIVLNQIGQVAEDVERLSTLISILRQNYGRNVWGEIAKKLSKTSDDTAQGKITFKQGLKTDGFTHNTSGAQIDAFGNTELNNAQVRGTSELQGDVIFGNVAFIEGVSGGKIWKDGYNNIRGELDYLRIRKKLSVTEVEIQEVNYIGGSIVLSPADGFTVIGVYDDDGNNCYRLYFETDDPETGNVSTPQWRVGDLAFCQHFNMQNAQGGDLIHRWWRLVDDVAREDDEQSEFYGKYYIAVSYNTGDYEPDSSTPKVGDKVVMLGHIKRSGESDEAAEARQGAIMLAAAGASSDSIPYIRIYRKIHEFSLATAQLVADMSYARFMAVTNELYFSVEGGTNQSYSEKLTDIDERVANIEGQEDESFRVWHGETTATPTLENLPASQWGTTTDPYSEHVGDLYLTSDGLCYEFTENNGTYSWRPVSDKWLIKYVGQIGEKKRVFTSQPTSSAAYDPGDLWVNATWTDGTGTTFYGVIVVCNTGKAAGDPFSMSHWQLASTELQDFIENGLGDAIREQVDGKVVSYFTEHDYASDDPTDGWTTSEYPDHIGDTWYVHEHVSGGSASQADINIQIGDDILMIWGKNDLGNYGWKKSQDEVQIQTMRLAYTAQDTADGKRTTFTTQPTPPYEVGDLWVCDKYPSDGTHTSSNQSQNKYYKDILACANRRASGTFAISDWTLASNYGILANNALTRLAAIDDDEILSMSERNALEMDWQGIQSEYAQRITFADNNDFEHDDEHEIEEEISGGNVDTYLFSDIYACYKGIFSIMTDAMSLWLDITADTRIDRFETSFAYFDNSQGGYFPSSSDAHRVYIDATEMDTIFGEYYKWKGRMDAAISLLEHEDHYDVSTLKTWTTQKEGVIDAANMFVGTFDNVGTTSNPIWRPKEAGGLCLTMDSTGLKLYYKTTEGGQDVYRLATMGMRVEEDNSTSPPTYKALAEIVADQIKLEGYTTINNSFGIDLSGNMWARRGEFSGLITHKQTLIYPDVAEEYGTYDGDGDYIIDITKCGQYITLFDPQGSDDNRVEDASKHLISNINNAIYLNLPFVCDYNHVREVRFEYYMSGSTSGSTSKGLFLASRQVFLARAYVGCKIFIQNLLTTGTNVKIKGVEGYGQDYYVLTPASSFNSNQLVALECVSQASTSSDASLNGNEEIVWRITSLAHPRMYPMDDANTGRYYVGINDEDQLRDNPIDWDE